MHSSIPRIIATLLMGAMPLTAAAQTITILQDSPHITQSVQEALNATSQNDLDIVQQAGNNAQQAAGMTGVASTIVNTVQNFAPTITVTSEQTCPTGSGTQLCIEDASPVIHITATQDIDALSENVLNIVQQAGEESAQKASMSGAALTEVAAAQTVTPQTVVSIFQDCTIEHGVCVQRALPEVLTLAQQMITATALNQLSIDQEAGSGSAQEAAVEAAAQVGVSAQQFVNPQSFLFLSQLCTVNTGMCIQKALPLIQTVVEQVVEAQTGNTIALSQSGGLLQDAAADATGQTVGALTQNVLTENAITVLQECNVAQGLCVSVDANGTPTFVFSDGDTTTTGVFAGQFDDSPLDTDYSRQSVAQVAGGICGENASCSMLSDLLFWLFGPEPQPVVVRQEEGSQQSDEDAAHRGHRTNVLAASAEFLAAHLGITTDMPAPAFGGSEEAMSLSEQHHQLICSMRKAIPVGSDPEVWQWTAERIASLTGMSSHSVSAYLQDEGYCGEAVAAVDARVTRLAGLTFFMVDEFGIPVSHNPTWNKCIRGESVTLAGVRAHGSCASFHTQDSWMHPDLQMYFTWNRHTGVLELPEGYVKAVTGS